jgi:hypothetical protein
MHRAANQMKLKSNRMEQNVPIKTAAALATITHLYFSYKLINIDERVYEGMWKYNKKNL